MMRNHKAVRISVKSVGYDCALRQNAEHVSNRRDENKKRKNVYYIYDIEYSKIKKSLQLINWQSFISY